MKYFKASLLLILGLCGCSRAQKTETPSAADFAPYIKAYTGGIVTEDAQLRVDLTEAVAVQPEGNLFTLSPKAEGVTQWTSPSTVRFIPADGALKAGKNYTVSFALGKVRADAPETFDFGIAVKGTPEAVSGEEEPDNGQAFRVMRTALEKGKIKVEMSQAPVNASLQGLVELSGAARYYVQTEDKTLWIHFEQAVSDLKLTLDKSLKDAEGHTLGSAFEKTFVLGQEKPAIEIPLHGNILPDKQALVLPFRAVNLAAVEVRVVKIYEKNVLMFLQDNDLGENGSLRRSGRLVYRGDVWLDPSKDLQKWNTHSIELGQLFKQEPGAIYRIRLSFRQDQSLWGGREVLRNPEAPAGKPSAQDNEIWDRTNAYYWDNDYNWEEYNWQESDDPSKPSYYMDSNRFPSIQLIASDLGLTAQYAGGDRIWLAATDLMTAKPVSGATLEVYDFQLQRMAGGKTGADGLLELKLDRKPFAVVGKAGGSTAYLKITAGNQRSLSRFDVGGETLQAGLKAFIYGERGVWRPGDTLHVTSIISDKGKSLPAGHPATLEVYTPAGQFHSKLVRKGIDGFYAFDIPTKETDPTGYWNAYLKVGGSSFHKTLHIENIKPNRLKIETSWGRDVLQAGKSVQVKTSAEWLTGAVAGGLPARAEITLRRGSKAPFAGFEKYTFTNPASSFKSTAQPLYKTQLDAMGNATLNVTLPVAESAPGMLEASIVTSVAEPGGDESFTTETLRYSPYPAYVGICVPDGEYLETDVDQPIRLAVVDAEGKRLKGRKLEYAAYKLDWNWWWDNPGGDLDAYVNGEGATKIANGQVSSGDKDVSFILREEYPKWGRYLILVRDIAGGHVAGKIVTFDWPEYRGRASRRDPEALTMVTFSSDKPSYRTGEKATIYIPAAKNGRALVSLENGSGVLRREWVSTSEEDTPFRFEITPEMAPNIYVHLTLLQPYGNTVNDLPMRLYGVQRISVENPASHLEPQVQAPQVIHPEESFTLKVSEKSGKPMTYTLAIVDEGLLDLTAFKTPDPWSKMFKPEALGVNTWDLYDQVIGATGQKLIPLSSIGGDEDAVKNARKDNRFNPVVMYLPPRTLSKGTDVLKLKLPMYVGSVRIMVVAAHEGAFGHAEKTVSVQNPLMVVTTLPRLLGEGEEVAVPVNVFAMENNVREATVSIKADGPVTLGPNTTQTVRFDGVGDQVVRFSLKGNGEGVAHITVNASGAGYKATETTALTIRQPNPLFTSAERWTLAPGQRKELTGGSGRSLQLAGFPALDTKALYAAMRDYPYSCGEQLSAKGITLISLLPMLQEEDAAEARQLIPTCISSLYARQNADGGFACWSGGQSDTWVSSMAGQFLTEAAKAGFEVNKGVLQSWKSYQRKMTQVYRITGNQFFPHLDEAYRLYTLALAGEPVLAGMNRLKEAGAEVGDKARWMLASAYALAGKVQLSNGILEGMGQEFPEYEPYNITYGTAFRDQMVAMEALVRTGRINDALALAREALPQRALSTQETAFATWAYRCLYDKIPGTGIQANLNGKSISSDASCITVGLPAEAKLENQADTPLYGTVFTTSRQPRSKAESNGLKVEVEYKNESGASVSPSKLKQGERIRATIKVSNLSGRSLENLALSMAIPSGWEIVNERMSGGAPEDGYDHKDIRDTRIDWFFGLPAGRYKNFAVELRAAYEGKFVQPAIICNAMYEPSVNACTASGTAEVSR